MATKKQIKCCISEIDSFIALYEEQRSYYEKLRLASIDFDYKNHCAGIENKFEEKIKLIYDIRNIVIENLV